MEGMKALEEELLSSASDADAEVLPGMAVIDAIGAGGCCGTGISRMEILARYHILFRPEMDKIYYRQAPGGHRPYAHASDELVSGESKTDRKDFTGI